MWTSDIALITCKESRLITAALDDYSIFSFFWFLRMRGVLATIDRVRRFTAKEGKSVVHEVRDTAQSTEWWYWGYTDSKGIDGIAGHTLWELHFCVLI